MFLTGILNQKVGFSKKGKVPILKTSFYRKQIAKLCLSKDQEIVPGVIVGSDRFDVINALTSYQICDTLV